MRDRLPFLFARALTIEHLKVPLDAGELMPERAFLRAKNKKGNQRRYDPQFRFAGNFRFGFPSEQLP
jgi:hypothetical protein